MSEVYEVNFNMGGIGGMPGGAGAVIAPGMNNAEERQQNAMKNYAKLLKDNTSGFWKKIGIDLTLRSMLKQSQLFTSVFGSFFQIVGAAIDVILVPFMPIIVPVIKKLASWIPDIKDAAQDIFNWGKAILTTIWNPIKTVFESIGKLLPDSVKQAMGDFFGHRQWKLLMAAVAVMVSTRWGRRTIARGFGAIRSERAAYGQAGAGAVWGGRGYRAAGMGLRGTRMSGGFAGRRGGGIGRLMGMGRMGMMGGGLGMLGAGALTAQGMSEGGNTMGSTALRVGAMGAMGVGMAFGPVGMLIGASVGMALNHWASKMQAETRQREQQAASISGSAGSNFGATSVFNIQGANATSVQFQREVGQVMNAGSVSIEQVSADSGATR